MHEYFHFVQLYPSIWLIALYIVFYYTHLLLMSSLIFLILLVQLRSK